MKNRKKKRWYCWWTEGEATSRG